MSATDKTHVVYRAYDDEGTLLYIGLTRNLGRRMSEHERSSAWFRWMARYEVSGPYNEGWAYSLEGRLIARMCPVFNLSHANGGEGPQQYLARRASDEATAMSAAMRHAMTSLVLPTERAS